LLKNLTPSPSPFGEVSRYKLVPKVPLGNAGVVEAPASRGFSLKVSL